MTAWCYFPLFALLFVCASASAQEEGDAVDASSIPPRPTGQILDQARWFTAEEKESAQEKLSQLFTENNIDVYLVTQKELPPQGAAAFARALGEEWSRSPVWCVVFQVPGDPTGFHVEAGGVEMDRGLIDQTLKEAIRRARRENTEKDRVMSAWTECSEGLRFIHGASMRTNERRVDATKLYMADQKRIKFLRRVYIAAGVIGFLALLTIAIIIVLRLRAKNATYVFPETSWRTRFQGPHSGGSGLVVNYHRKKLK